MENKKTKKDSGHSEVIGAIIFTVIIGLLMWAASVWLI